MSAPHTVPDALGPHLPASLLEELAAGADQAVVADAPDRGLITRLRTTGLLGTAVSTRYGGRGGDGAEINRVVELLARHNPSLAIIAFQHFAVSARITEWGTAAQRLRWLPRLASGEWIAASAWSEPGAGAAKKAISSTGTRQADGTWLLEGAKSFTTGASIADLYLVLLRTGEPTVEPGAAYGSTGQSFFIVEAANPGVAPDLSLRLEGMRGSATGFVALHGCVVGEGDMLGPDGDAARIIAGVRSSGATLGAVALGIAQAAFDLLTERLAARGMLTWELVRHRVVELATAVESARAIVERAGARTAADPGTATLFSKLHCSAVAEQTCLEAARLLGSEAYTSTSRFNRLLADARAVALMGPTDELCRELIAVRAFR